MDAEITVRMTAELRQAVVRCVLDRGRRQVKILLVIVVALMAALMVALMATSVDGVMNYGLVLLGIFIFCFAILVLSRRGALRAAREAAGKFGEIEVRMRITDEGFHFTTPYARGMYPWRIFPQLQRFPEMWLLYSDNVNAFVLPAEGLAPEVRQFIEAKVREAGGKVT